MAKVDRAKKRKSWKLEWRVGGSRKGACGDGVTAGERADVMGR